jgi:3-deoxy-D-manno-octulosonic-acid transferase
MTSRPLPNPWLLTAYRAAAGLVSPLAGTVLKARARQGKEDPARLRERLGHASLTRPAGALIWMHAVSVGESLSLLPLVAALQAERPDLAILVTSGTQASAEILARRLPAGVLHQYAPVDTPGAVRRFVRHWRADVGLFVESELWPNLILAARDAGTRLALISARITEKSAQGWAARPAAARAILGAFELILAQDRATEQRLLALGGAVTGRLNLKRLCEPLPYDADELVRLQGMISSRPVIVAVSTHSPEELMVAAAAARIASNPLAIIVPRHPERGDEIARQLALRRVARRSAGDTIGPETGVYLADTMGEVGLFLRLAPFAIIGGGFSPEIGGHNPMEAANLGIGVVTGRHVANHAEMYGELVAAGAALMAGDEMELTAQVAALLADATRQAAMAAAAAAYSEAQSGQLSAALELLRPLLPAP